MGTRAVVHANLNPYGYGKDVWIATHWDGNPDFLGKDLVNSIKDEVRKNPKDIGGALQVAVLKASAEHHVDVMENTEKEFNEKYGDWAEYEYEVTADGKIKVRPLSGEWSPKRKGKWKILATVQETKAKNRLKEIV